MKVKGLVGFVVASFALAGVWAAQGPSEVLHTPPTTSYIGDPVPLSVVVKGVPDREPRVTVFYRSQGDGTFLPLDLEFRGPGTYSGEITGRATRGLALNYYVEVTGPQSSYVTKIGARNQPLSVLLLEPSSGNSMDRLVQIGIGLLSIAMVAGIVVLRDRSRRRVTLDRVFWMKTLEPVVKMRGEGADEYIELLSQRELDHPTDGTKTYSAEMIVHKLAEIRNLDPQELRLHRERYLGAGYELPKTKPGAAVSEVRSRLREVAARVGRLCAAAWLISRVRRGHHATQSNFLKPLEAVRRAVRQVQKALEKGQVDQAQALLHAVDEQAAEMNRQFAEADQDCSASDLATCMASMDTITADMLGRLVEYYALVAVHCKLSRDKMIAVATEMARRDSLRGDAPARIQAALRRRGVLQDGKADDPDPAMAKRAEEMRQLLAIENPTKEVMENLRPLIEAFKNDLDDTVYSLEGLSQVVSLELLLERKSNSLERTEAGSFDSVAAEFDKVVERDVSRLAASKTAEADDDPTALESMRMAEEQLHRCVAQGDLEENGFYLEEFELEALEKQQTNPALAALVTHCIACLTAMNRVARDHSKAGQPAGVEPPPLPRPMAETLVRRAGELCRDLQDFAEKELMQGQYLRAKECNRFMHRLHRTRIGLALLGKVPVEG